MTMIIPIKDVKMPRHLEAFVTKFSTGTSRQAVLTRMDVYTGVIMISANVPTATPIGDGIMSFLPIETKKSGRRHVLKYPEAFLKAADHGVIVNDLTVIASVSSSTDYDDQRNTVALDSTSVELRRQALTEIDGHPLCLVLKASLQAGAAIIHHVTYQVTLLSPVDMSQQSPEQPTSVPLDLDEIEVGDNEVPRDNIKEDDI